MASLFKETLEGALCFFYAGAMRGNYFLTKKGVLGTLSALFFVGSRLCFATPIPANTFVTLKAEQANLRTGPGKIYPAVWILCAPGLPLKVLSVFDMWCKVEDPLGSIGWLHKSLLSRHQQAFTLRDTLLLSAPEPKASAKACIQKGAVLQILKIYPQWFLVKAPNVQGYLPRHLCWAGLDPSYAQKSNR